MGGGRKAAYHLTTEAIGRIVGKDLHTGEGAAAFRGEDGGSADNYELKISTWTRLRETTEHYSSSSYRVFWNEREDSYPVRLKLQRSG